MCIPNHGDIKHDHDDGKSIGNSIGKHCCQSGYYYLPGNFRDLYSHTGERRRTILCLDAEWQSGRNEQRYLYQLFTCQWGGCSSAAYFNGHLRHTNYSQRIGDDDGKFEPNARHQRQLVIL